MMKKMFILERNGEQTEVGTFGKIAYIIGALALISVAVYTVRKFLNKVLDPFKN